ncbi:MAG: methionine biosynthesis protein MetW [Deltaproteobacteria bacterium RBG_13_52_11b]|nr:MAG: methionine biosynthesis protein MetW [Deltaproteobacteria bacterium RBG_13_52_11b]
MTSESLPLEYGVFLDWIEAGSSVLDLGCGDGKLLSLLVREKKVKAQGIEIDEQAIYRCVAKGLSVFHQDIDNGLSEYANKSFDYVILNQSFQQVKKPDIVLTEALRVSEKVIISFPNFAHYRARVQIFFNGRTPITSSLPYEWHDTPNLHFLSILDFVEYCEKRNITIETSSFVGRNRSVKIFPNLLALTGVFLISKK